MTIIEAENLSDATAQGLRYLLQEGIRESSRNGTVIVAPHPVMTVYQNPTQRVLFSGLRDANPFFHLMEALWMLAGRNDLAFPTYFNQRFKEYSDDGEKVHGAYGHRWRAHFGYDQLEVIARELKTNPATRRCVLAMWDSTPTTNMVKATGFNEPTTIETYGANDLNLAMSGGKDVPCNTHIYFDVRGGVLNMTVCCRSNDVVWGAYGANAVHMSILQEYMAAWVGVPVGVYRQFSNNYHAYTDVYNEDALQAIAKDAKYTDYYTKPAPLAGIPRHMVTPYPLVNGKVGTWNNDLADFLEDPLGVRTYNDEFFNMIAQPMYAAWHARKEKTGTGQEQVSLMADSDWKLACVQWIQRREASRAAS